MASFYKQYLKMKDSTDYYNQAKQLQADSSTNYTLIYDSLADSFPSGF